MIILGYTNKEKLTFTPSFQTATAFSFICLSAQERKDSLSFLTFFINSVSLDELIAVLAEGNEEPLLEACELEIEGLVGNVGASFFAKEKPAKGLFTDAGSGALVTLERGAAGIENPTNGLLTLLEVVGADGTGLEMFPDDPVDFLGGNGQKNHRYKEELGIGKPINFNNLSCCKLFFGSSLPSTCFF